MYDYQINDNFEIFDNFFTSFCKSLINEKNKNLLRANFKKRLEVGDYFQLISKKYDKNYQLSNNDKLFLHCKNPDNTITKKIMNKKNNFYDISFLVDKTGIYNFSIFNNDSSAFLKSFFTVDSLKNESQNTVSNHALLNDISVKSNGKFFHYTEAEKIKDHINNSHKNNDVRQLSLNLKDLKDEHWILLFVILFITSEILVRRLRGKK